MQVTSQEINVTGTHVLETKRVFKLTFGHQSKVVFLNKGTESVRLPEVFELSGARGQAFDAEDYNLTGSGLVTIYYFEQSTVTPGSATTDTYNPESNFEDILEKMFLDEFLTDQVTWTKSAGGSKLIRCSIEDERVLIGDGSTQYQSLLKTAHFKLADMIDGWKIGDTVTIAGIEWRANEILEQDQYTVKIGLSKSTR